MKDLDRSIKITKSCFKLARKLISNELTEKQIATEIKKYAMKLGAKGLAFPTIVSSGKNSSRVHPKPTYRRVKKTELVIVDMGIVIGNSRSDVTRTICIKPTSRQKKLMKIIKNAKSLAENQVRPGVKCKEVDKVARAFIKSKTKIRFPYALGHGVGKRIHQSPKITPKSKHRFKVGDIFTLEPGIHSTNFGIRFEDMYLLKRKGIVNLTKAIK
ncbi:MAG: M24 family metallopeptidase [Nanoarchaeota archaeon]|nr:M24 family metallopeptidase [Nanoarchaeota archaeon]